jgi:broad specificity phosphatase PhoE
MKLYFARHGESVGNFKNLFYGWTDYPLTENGYRQAQELGEKLRDAEIEKCYTSPLVRAAETARISMQGRNVPIVTFDDLKEQYMGDLEDTTLEDNMAKNPELIEAMFLDWTKIAPPGGESYQVLEKRALACLDGIISTGEDALIVAHNGVLATMITRMLDAPLGSIDRFWLLHGCYSCLSIVDGRIRLEYFNK